MADTVIDACCLLNVCAVDDHQQWLPRLGLCWHLPSAVYAETFFLNATDDDGRPVKRPIDLQRLVDGGILTVCAADTGREKRRYVELASELDDGEAMALAIAACRDWLFATDDRKAQRLAGELNVAVITTPDVIKLWVDKVSPSDSQISAALQSIRDRARFLPGRSVPLYDWWIGYLR